MHPAVNKSIITILETNTALAAARLMKETETGCLMVVDAGGNSLVSSPDETWSWAFWRRTSPPMRR